MYRTLWTNLTSKYPRIINLSGDGNNGSLALVDAENHRRCHKLFCMWNVSYGVGVGWWSSMACVPGEREAANSFTVFLGKKKTTCLSPALLNALLELWTNQWNVQLADISCLCLVVLPGVAIEQRTGWDTCLCPAAVGNITIYLFWWSYCLIVAPG